MLTFLAGSLLIVGVIGAAICYKFAETPAPPSAKKKTRIPDFDVGLNSHASSALSFRVARPTIVPV